MEKQGLFSELTMQKIKKVRKVFLWTAVWLLIGEFVLGAILILTQSWNVSIGKIQGTFLIITAILFVGVNNFIRLEKGSKAIQVFAAICFVANIIWAILACLLIWEVVPFNWFERGVRTGIFGVEYETNIYHMTFWAMTMAVALYAALASFWMSNVMAIKETVGAVKPLKITSMVCIVYIWAFGTITTLAEIDAEDALNLYQLSGLAGLAFGITTLAAWIISIANKKKVSVVPGKTEEELRTEIEEKVRREMIEKEVRGQVLTGQVPAGQSGTEQGANEQVLVGQTVIEPSRDMAQAAVQQAGDEQKVTEQMQQASVEQTVVAGQMQQAPVEQQIVAAEQVTPEQKAPEQTSDSNGAVGITEAKESDTIIEESFGGKEG